MNFLVPQGIGDSVWALLKVQDIAAKLGDGVVNIFIACIDKNNNAECRALNFINQFRFVNKCEMYPMNVLPGQCGAVLLPGPPTDENGLYRYIRDGETTLPNIDYVLMPNAPLERGIRLENWLPEFRCNWEIMKDFLFNSSETFDLENYAVFFLSSKGNNTTAGHNRDGLWKPEDWVQLGRNIQKELGSQVIVVGAFYDASYYDDCIKPLLSENEWINMIGKCDVSRTITIIKKSRFVISYQSGVGIVPNYMGVPSAVFWRPKGNSIDPGYYASFDENMSHAWADPKMIESERYMPLIYTRHDVDYITSEILRRKW